MSDSDSNDHVVDDAEILSVDDILGQPPLIRGESEENYWELLDRIRSAVSPSDFVEQIWARDIADLTWEIFRL